MSINSQSKAERLLQIETLLLAHPEGLNQSEMAKRLGVHRSTIMRNLVNISAPIYQEGNRYFIDREAYLVNVRFSLHEALAIHLAARLIATCLDRQNPHAASALRKLGLSMDSLAPRISIHLLQSADAMESSSRNMDSGYLNSLEKITLAWAQQVKIQLWYQSDASEEVKVYIFSPYFLEPYAIGQSTYTIGYSEPQNAIRTYKIERVRKAVILRDPYEIPTDFNPEILLADAWGIWYTEGKPVEIVLKFTPRVSGRVKETQWHQSEEIGELEDGSLLWRAWIAEPQEMMPWIRGWGADVEVMAPEALRQMMIEETKRFWDLYHKGR